MQFDLKEGFRRVFYIITAVSRLYSTGFGAGVMH